MEKIGVFLRVYNVRPYIDQCLSSVLSQTYSDFTFYIIDNGCTDGSSEILDQYAERDPRIRLTHYKQNNPDTYPFYQFIQEKDHPYIAILDSDDWWEPDYLERLLAFMQSNKLDISLTGTIDYFEETGISKVKRRVDHPVIITLQEFAAQFSEYWIFPSTYWGSLMKSSLYKKVDLLKACQAVPGYGQDTSVMLYYLEQCIWIGIDSSVLYHYRNRERSISSTYTPARFDANVMFMTVIRSFLEGNQVLTPSVQHWLYGMHLTSLINTVDVLKSAKMPFANKIRECGRIASHPLTVEALKHPLWERGKLKALIGEILWQAPMNGQNLPFEGIEQILISFAPNCGPAVTEEVFPLFLKEGSLFNALLRDERDEIAKMLLSFIAEGRYVKQYDLGVTLQALSGLKSLLKEIRSTSFIRKYRDIYWMIWVGQLDDALDLMTGLLLKDKVKGEKKTFLQLYLSVAAIQNEIAAFLFGNVQLAELYLQQKQYEECRTVLRDLEEMGLTDDEEVSAIRDKLNLEDALRRQ